MSAELPIRTLREWRLDVFSETQEEFAHRIGFDKSVLSLWESEKRTPHPKNRRKIAEALGLQPVQIAWPYMPRKNAPAAA